MDVAKAFTYITEDQNWLIKVGIATAVMLASTFLLFIPLPLLIGYQLGVTRRVMAGAENPLPEWDDLGTLFMDGLSVLVARLVYALPFILLLCVGIGVSLLPALGGNNEDAVNALAGVTAVTWVILSCFFFILALALLFITPAINIQYVRTNSLAACLRFGEVFGIARRHLGDILIVMLVLFLANLALQAVAGMLAATFCGIVLALPLAWVGSAWFSLTSGHLYGQIAAKDAPKSDLF